MAFVYRNTAEKERKIGARTRRRGGHMAHPS